MLLGFHCHKSHHAMSAVGHDIPTTIGIDHRGIAEKIVEPAPDYIVIGERDMAVMAAVDHELQ